MSSSEPAFSPGDRAVVRSAPTVPDLEPGTIVWLRRVAGDQVEVETAEPSPRRLTVPLAALAALPATGERIKQATKGRAPADRPSLLTQILRPIAVLLFMYLMWQAWGRWPKWEEPKALPSPKTQQPAMPRQ
jgi:hypothetical protein